MGKVIGLPVGLHFYYDRDFWEYFFGFLSIKYILSDNNGFEHFDNNNFCYPLKIYLNRVSSLKDKCDYILVPNVINCDYECQNCFNIVNIVNILKHFTNMNLLIYDVNLLSKQIELNSLIKLGRKLKIEKYMIIDAYYKSIKKVNAIRIMQYEDNIIKLYSNRIKILIIGYSYIVHDEILMHNILKILKNNKYELIFADQFNCDICDELSYNLIHNLYSKKTKAIIGAIEMVKNKVNGIMFIGSCYCTITSIVYNLINHIINVPVINIDVEDLNNVEKVNNFVLNIERMFNYAG